MLISNGPKAYAKSIFHLTTCRVDWDKFVLVEDPPVDASDFDDSSLWNDMEIDANSLRNTYQVDVDDAGVALTGVSEYPALFLSFFALLSVCIVLVLILAAYVSSPSVRCRWPSFL